MIRRPPRFTLDRSSAASDVYKRQLLRMYMRYCEKRGWKVEVSDSVQGEEAGYKNVSLRVEGDYAYGYLKAEIGVLSAVASHDVERLQGLLEAVEFGQAPQTGPHTLLGALGQEDLHAPAQHQPDVEACAALETARLDRIGPGPAPPPAPPCYHTPGSAREVGVKAA